MQQSTESLQLEIPADSTKQIKRHTVRRVTLELRI